jgi:hypothetical protein
LQPAFESNPSGPLSVASGSGCSTCRRYLPHCSHLVIPPLQELAPRPGSAALQLHATLTATPSAAPQGWAEVDLQALEAEQGPQGKELQLQLNDAVSGTVHLIARVQRLDAASGAGDLSLSQLPWSQLGALSTQVLGVRMPAALGSRQWVPASGARGGIKAGRQASLAGSMTSGGSEPRRRGQHARESCDSEEEGWGEAAAEEEEEAEESRMQSSVLAGTTRLQRCKSRKAAQVSQAPGPAPPRHP